MIVLRNDIKKVLIFKSAKAKPVRLFPGQNGLDMSFEDFKANFLEGNVAANAMFDGSCGVVSGSNIKGKEAKASRDKNEILNKSRPENSALTPKPVSASEKIVEDAFIAAARA